MPLHVGLYVPTWHRADGSLPSWAQIRTLARDADTLWVADEPGFWECWTILTALAEATERVGIGPLVACTRYRSPALFATMVNALDEVSAGRLVVGLGLGAGPGDARWSAFGFDGTDHVARFAESVEITARLLRAGPIAFDGRFERVADPDIGPRGPHPAGPPIWIAARRTRALAVAARWGDAVNSVDPLTDADAVARFAAALDAACETVDRDPATVARTGWTRIAPSADGRLDADRTGTISGTPAAIAERLLEIEAAGIEHLTCFIGDEDDGRLYPALTGRSLQRFAPILEAVREAIATV